MKIVKAEELRVIRVETDESEYSNYTRYSSDCWYVQMGESDEPVYDCEELENLYQKYLKAESTKDDSGR